MLLSKKTRISKKFLNRTGMHTSKQAQAPARSWRPGTILCGFLDDTIDRQHSTITFLAKR